MTPPFQEHSLIAKTFFKTYEESHMEHWKRSVVLQCSYIIYFSSCDRRILFAYSYKDDPNITLKIVKGELVAISRQLTVLI